MNPVDNKKPRFSVSVDADLYEKINKYQHEQRINSQTQAIAAILKIGIKAIMEEGDIVPVEDQSQPEIPEQLAKIIEVYYSLNDTGQKLLEIQANLLSKEAEYKKDSATISPKRVG